MTVMTVIISTSAHAVRTNFVPAKLIHIPETANQVRWLQQIDCVLRILANPKIHARPPLLGKRKEKGPCQLHRGRLLGMNSPFEMRLVCGIRREQDLRATNATALRNKERAQFGRKEARAVRTRIKIQ